MGFWLVREPYGQPDWKFDFGEEPPPGVKVYPDQKSAFATIQTYRGTSPAGRSPRTWASSKP